MTSSTIPLEIIQDIIADLWSGPLSIKERIVLMTSSALVSTSWMVAFTNVSLRDVHIPCAAYVRPYLALVRTYPYVNGAARSLTFHIQHTLAVDRGTPERCMAGEPISYMLCIIKDQWLPNLRRLSVESTNIAFDNAILHLRSVFPKQVTTLELKYIFDSQYTPAAVEGMRTQIARDEDMLERLPSVRHLSVIGGGEGFVIDMITACCRAVTVVTDARAPADVGFVLEGKRGPINAYAFPKMRRPLYEPA